MKVCAISDLHGDLITDIQPCDLVIICGDSVPLNKQASERKTWRWYINQFKDWAENLPCEKVLFIAGNHELYVQNHEQKYKSVFSEEDKVTFLSDDLYTYKHNDIEYKIYGTPWCQVFGRWAYMLPYGELVTKYSKIPDDLDILITHDAPFGVSDVLLQEDCTWATAEYIGSKALAKAIKKKKPKLVLHGHLHSSSHDIEQLCDSKVVNCSIKDELYRITYLPFYIEL